MIEIQSLDLTKAAGSLDEGALRFWAFDSVVRLNLAGWPVFEFAHVPVIQFFRSLFTALDGLKESGAAQWEVIDTGVTFLLSTHGDEMAWAARERSVKATCSFAEFSEDARRSWKEVRDSIIESHPYLAGSSAFGHVM